MAWAPIKRDKRQEKHDEYQRDRRRGLATCRVPTLVAIGTADAGGTEHSRDMFQHSPDPAKEMAWIKGGGTHFMRGQEDKQLEAAAHTARWVGSRGLA
jgi:hypothetical protein